MLLTNMMNNKALASSSFYLLVTFIFLPPSYESNYFFSVARTYTITIKLVYKQKSMHDQSNNNDSSVLVVRKKHFCNRHDQ